MIREIIQKVNDTTIIVYDDDNLSGYRFINKKGENTYGGNSVYFTLTDSYPNQPILVEKKKRFAPVVIAIGQQDINEYIMLHKIIEEEE